MDGTAFSCCVHNKLTSGVSDWAVLERCSDNSQLSGNYDPLRTACSTCGRNCTCRKCKPWRRKCLLSTRPKWTWFNILCSLNLLLLLASLSHAVLNGLSRTMSVKKTSRLRLHFLLLIACFLGGTFLPFASCQGSLQSSPSVKSQLNNAVVYVGSAFSYNISTSVFDCEVDSIVVSETADRFLSHWLSYNSEKKQLYGVPSDKDEGTYNILVVALTKDSAVRGHVCGSRSFSIVVMPVSNELPVSVHFGTGGFRSYHKSSPSLSCLPGMQTVLGTVVLNADMQSLNGHERMVLLLKMADHLKIHTSKVSFFPGESSHPMTEQLDNLAIMAAGVGDGRFAKGSRSLVTWNIGCGAFKLEDAAFSRLETDSQDGTISTLLGFPVVGWHVTSGAQKNLARRRVRRAAGGIGFTPTPTPTATSAAPTRMSNVSTSVVMSRTVTLTSSAGSINSTITLPVSTSVTLSVAPNRTIIQSTDASINTTIFSQSLPRTIQSSTLGINFTVSSQSPNSTDIQSSSVSINVTTSSRSFSVNFTVSSQSPNITGIQTSSVSRNVTTSSRSFSKTGIQSSNVTNFSSSMTSFSPTSILNSSVLTGVSFTPVLSRNATQFLNRTSSLVTTSSLNLTFITRTASPSISLSVPLISSLSLPTTTRAGNSSIFVMSPNESATFVTSSPIVSSFSMTSLSNATVLIPSTPQLNSTEVTRTSQFTVSSNIILITSTSLLSSPSLVRTTFQPTSAITISASQLNSSTPNVTSPALSTSPSPTVITSSRSVTVATTSVLVTASVNQTINSSSILSATVTRTFSISPTSSLVILVPNTTSLENVTSFMTSGFVTSSPALLPSTSQLESTMLLNRTLPMPVSTFLTTSSVPTMTSTQRSTFALTSSLVPSLSFSSVTLSNSLIQPSSTLVSSSNSERLNVTYCTSVPTMTSTQRSTFAITSSLVSSLNFSSATLSSSLIQPSSSERLNVTSAGNTTSVVANITSATLQPSVTSATSVNMSSLAASPLVTSVNLTSVVITVNVTTTKRTAVENSTSVSERSTFVTLATSVFLPTRTSGTRAFPSTFTTNRTVVVSSSGGVDTSSVNISSTPKSTRTTFLLSSGSSVSTFQFSRVVTSSVLSHSFTKLPNTTFVTVSASSEVRVNSTALSRTQERSSALTSAVTRLGNSSVSPRRDFSSNTTQVMVVSTRTVSSTAFVANSSSVVPSFSRSVTNASSFISPSSGSISRSSTVLLPNTSSLVAVSKTSVTFSSTVRSAESSLTNTSTLISTGISTALKSTSLLTTAIFTRNRTVISTTQVSLTMTTPLLNSSLVASSLKSQSLSTAISTSGIVKSSVMLKNSTAVLSTITTVSPSSSALVASSSSVLASSSFGINSTLITETPSFTVTPTSATVSRTTVAVLLTSATGIPTSSPIQNTSSFARTASPSTVSTLVLSPSTMQTEFTMPVNSTQSTRTLTRSTRVPHSSSRVVSVSSKLSSFVQSSVTVIPTSRPQVNRTTSIRPTSGSLPSSSALFSSNTTSSVTATDATQTVSVLPTSSVPATAPPTSPPNLPPLLLNNIGRVRAPAGKALQFTIPDDTFYDREDRAATRDLTLSMTLANGSNIPTDFWLQFDIASQTINGLPLDEHVPDGILGQVLVLRARDNNSAETFDAFEVLVVPSETPVVQELRVRITNEFATFNLALKLALLKKIAAYYDDADESKIRVLTFSPGSVIMTWTNDSLPTDSCDEEKLQYVTNKMLLPNGEVREEFREALQGFPVVSASQERFGVCNGSFIVPTETPIDPARKEARVEEHLWYKHVLVGLLIIVIIIVLVALLIWYCRRRRPKPLEEKRTFKKRKPIVLGPEIELKPLPGKPLVLPDDDPSLTPSYISETSFNKPTYSDDEDEEDYGKRSPSVVYEPPPPFYPAQDDDPRNSPPPAYLMPPMY